MFQSHHLISRVPVSNCFPLHLGAAAAAAPSTHHHQLRTVKPARLLFLARVGEVDAASQGGSGEGSDDGPVLLPPRSSSSSSIFATSDDPSPLQVSTSVLLTGAISVFLFRSLRRRAKRAKEMRMRSTGVTSAKGLKEEALQNLKAMSSTTIQPGAPPSPVQAFLGGIAAGVVAVILYKFTTTIEAALNRQAVSDNFSVESLSLSL